MGNFTLYNHEESNIANLITFYLHLLQCGLIIWYWLPVIVSCACFSCYGFKANWKSLSNATRSLLKCLVFATRRCIIIMASQFMAKGNKGQQNILPYRWKLIFTVVASYSAIFKSLIVKTLFFHYLEILDLVEKMVEPSSIYSLQKLTVGYVVGESRLNKRVILS